LIRDTSLSIAFAGLLKRLCGSATFFYDGKTYDGSKVAKIAPTADFLQRHEELVPKENWLHGKSLPQASTNTVHLRILIP
jgi:hypothetical protein